jgi:sulfide:quinone oxidoreductase
MTKHIAVLGSGFAGLAAAKTLRKLDPNLEISLISPKAEFVYLPSIIWMASGKRKASDLVLPLANFFQRTKITHMAAAVTGLKDGGKTVLTDQGEIKCDGVIIACGGKFIKKLPGIEHVITPCEGIAAGEAFKTRLDELDGGTIAFGFSGNPKEPAAMRGGPIFEFLFGTDQLLRQQGRRDRFQLVFFSPAPKPGLRLGEVAVEKLMGRMKKLDIKAYTGEKLAGFTKTSFKTETQEVSADLTVFMPGMTGNSWFGNSGLPLSDGGMIKAGVNCKVEDQNWPFVYVAGDAGSFPGPGWMPKQAHMAELQAHSAATNLLAELDGRAPDDKFETELICLIDSENKGALVYRKGKRSLMLPPLRAGHWAKRAFERMHLRQYR